MMAALLGFFLIAFVAINKTMPQIMFGKAANNARVPAIGINANKPLKNKAIIPMLLYVMMRL